MLRSSPTRTAFRFGFCRHYFARNSRYPTPLTAFVPAAEDRNRLTLVICIVVSNVLCRLEDHGVTVLANNPHVKLPRTYVVNDSIKSALDGPHICLLGALATDRKGYRRRAQYDQANRCSFVHRFFPLFHLDLRSAQHAIAKNPHTANASPTLQNASGHVISASFGL